MSAPTALSTFIPLAGFGGRWEILIILFIILLLFGRRLPGVARSLGQGISSFKKGLNDPLDAADDEEAKAEAKADKKSSKADESAA